jgi:beta-lactam-binding protein with PASTA domain
LYVTVPRLVGLSLQQAKSTLWDNGLNVGKVVYDQSVDDIISRRQARVYKQSQSLGSRLGRGSEVTLYLSCDEQLVDSLSVEATKQLKALETQRRKEQEALKKQEGEE